MKARTFAKGNRRTLRKLKELRGQALNDKATRVVLRLQGIMMSLQRLSVNEISHLLHVQRSSVHTWVMAWNRHGQEGLLEGHRSGRPPRLSEPDRERLLDIVDSGPVAYGLYTGVWTSPIISGLIEEEFGVTYHPGHVRKVLQQIGCSVQRPTTQLVRADKAKQRRWTRYTYPNLKKKPVRKTP